VLVVEDEGLIAHDIAQRLEALGHEVVGPVSTAEEAIESAPGADIVLMDIRIDGYRDGIEAATEIRNRHHLPVIFLTAHADRATLDRAKLAGPFGYIVKPLGPASLQTGVEMAIAKHRADRLVEEREAWLRAALGSIADAAVVTGENGRVRLLNAAAERLTGWSQADAEGQHVQRVVRLIEQGSGQEELDFVPVALLRDEPVELDRGCRLLARDGRELEIEGSVAPVRLSGELLGAVMTFRDASARHWEERQIRQSQRLEAAGRLAAGTANEYTALIGMIRKQTEHLLAEFGEYSPACGPLEEIRQAATSADQITRRLAAFGTRQVTKPEILSMNSLLRRMSRLIESAAGNQIRVAIRPSPGAGRIRADTTQMESAVMSLVHHACAVISVTSSAKTPGQMLIETARLELPHAGRAAEYVMLALTYSGVENDVEHLFEPGSVADTGLALASVHSVAAECGGYLSARSAFEGGSRIEMLIPRVSDQALLTAPSVGPKTAIGFAPSILVVDDRGPVRTELHNFFEAAGFNLLEAASIGEAVALGEIHESELDLLVAPVDESDAILKQLRGAHAALQALRVVDQPEQGRDEIRRPFTRQALLERVTELLSVAGVYATTSSST
jgi:hypothetical protein